MNRESEMEIEKKEEGKARWMRLKKRCEGRGEKRRKRENGRKLARNTVKHYVHVFKHITGTWDKDQS